MHLVITWLILLCVTVYNSCAVLVNSYILLTLFFFWCTEAGCAGISSSEDDQEISSATKYIFSPSTHLTQMQRMKVEKRVQDVCSSTPIFGCVMTKCNITRNPCYLVSLIFFPCLNVFVIISSVRYLSSSPSWALPLSNGSRGHLNFLPYFL